MIKIKLLLFSFVIFFFLGCEKKDSVGPSNIHWDRDMCDRCVMVISDRKNTLQFQDTKSKKIFKFDDIGCMILWFKEGNAQYENGSKIWITDFESGEWIDARGAFYTEGNITPMGFGFSAYKSKESIKKGVNILTYDEVLEKIK